MIPNPHGHASAAARGALLIMNILVPGLVLLAATALRALSAQPTEQPNFILIFADDLGYGDIGPFGSTNNRTPHLDRMAREGMKLTSFYAAPVCTPSRAQLLTGCYAKRVSLPQVLFPASPIGLNSNEHTVAELLRAQGYATICIGKWHVGDAPEFLPTRHGFDHYFGLPYSNDMGGPERREAASPPDGPTAKQEAADSAPRTAAAVTRKRPRKDRRPPLPLVKDEQVIETVTARGQEQLTERYTEEALRFIRQHREQPFFLYFPQTAVHVPVHPGDRFRGKSRSPYSDWVEELDWSVGRVLDTVRELGLAQRTLVFFTSDNGPWLTQRTNGGVAGPLRGGKGGTYEGGVREPTLAWWPGRVPAGSVCDAVAGNIDFLPTFVSLAGGAVPANNPIDGKDISALLLGRSTQSPHPGWFYFAGTTLQAVRSGPWKLALTRQSEGMGKAAVSDPAGPFTPKLYNLQFEISERTDLAALHPDVVQRLQQLVAGMDADLGATRAGPGVRSPGRIERPIGLWLPGHAPDPAETNDLTEPVPPLNQLSIGDTLDSADAPAVANTAFTITCEVEAKTTNGVIVAHGGSVTGYALHWREGKPAFTVRVASKPVAITASHAAPTGRFRLEARLAADGEMTLRVEGKVSASGRAPGLIPHQPQEEFCVGHDSGNSVGHYPKGNQWLGSISNLNIVVGQ